MRAWFSGLLDRFQAKFPPNRLVALAMVMLLPTVIVPAAGYFAVWVPQHFPGLPTFTAAQLTAYGVAGASAALLAGITAGYKWLDGWQKHEARSKGIGFYHEGFVDPRNLPNDRRWVGVNGDPTTTVAAGELDANGREREAQRKHEIALAVLKTADTPWIAQEALAELEGRNKPNPESPLGAVGDVQPPPPPSPVAEHRESPPAPSQPPTSLPGALGQPPGPPWPGGPTETPPRPENQA